MLGRQEIIGLPVFKVSDGKRLGKVIDLILTADEGRIEYLLISQRNKYLGLKVIPFKSVSAIGKNAITIKNEKALKDLEDSKAAIKLLEEDLELMGKEILLENGDLLGRVVEMQFDPDSGKIDHFEYSPVSLSGPNRILHARDVICYGFDVIVAVPSAVNAETAVFQPGPLFELRTVEKPPLHNQGALIFREKQRQFLLGKHLIREIRNPSTQIFFPEGTLITEDVLDAVDDNKMFMELTQYAR